MSPACPPATPVAVPRASIARLIARLYAQAAPTARWQLLVQLLRPLGPLALVGIAAVVLGILALVGINPVVLVFVAVLCLGGAELVSGFATSAFMATLQRR